MDQEPNDLLDRRDQILRDLSNITNISVIDGRQQTVTVQINGTSLVDFDTINEIEIIKPKSKDEVTRLVWSKGKSPVTFNGGEIKGLVETRDDLLTQNLKNLDTMAKALIDATNAIHRDGFGLDNTTGLSFFDADSTDASNIKVSEAILQNPSKIAASTRINAPGNGDNALAIAEILNMPLLNGNTTTINAFLDGMVAKLGVQGQEAIRTIDNQETLVHYLNIEQNQYTSVSLDEEMANMMKYQHAYNAAARMVSTLDDALDTIISRMGIVGR
jgi:flagellar hook-associated protein 1 FlgK